MSGSTGVGVGASEVGDSWGGRVGMAHGVASAWDAIVSSMLASPPVNGVSPDLRRQQDTRNE